jgi:hypothetical protein
LIAAALHAMTSYVSVDLRRLVQLRASHLCEYCLIHEGDTYFGCQVDHVIAEKHGAATARVLGFNTPERVLEREALQRMGGYPPEAAGRLLTDTLHE